ncbi:MAG: helix-turn-helix transcriptional regulator [Burkholderiales bacterium]|nr:helix-turn-helix transcriptional regulator [Burkholderiales bacterium]
MNETDTPAAAGAQSRFIAPRLALGSCLRGFVVRCTAGRALRPDERLNHLPATPACAITWFFHGTAEWAHERVPAPRISFCGPRTKPATSFNPGPVETLTMLVMPDALQALTGFDAPGHADRACGDATTLFGPAWQPMLQAVLDAPGWDERIGLIEDFLEPRWRALKPGAWGSARTYRDWVEGLTVRALTAGVGRSARQTHRRIRAWAGLPLGTLSGLARAERALIDAHTEQALGRLRWGDVAAAAGYADQPHLCREARRIAGLSPRQLLRRINNDESFWIYRLWL